MKDLASTLKESPVFSPQTRFSFQDYWRRVNQSEFYLSFQELFELSLQKELPRRYKNYEDFVLPEAATCEEKDYQFVFKKKTLKKIKPSSPLSL